MKRAGEEIMSIEEKIAKEVQARMRKAEMDVVRAKKEATDQFKTVMVKMVEHADKVAEVSAIQEQLASVRAMIEAFEEVMANPGIDVASRLTVLKAEKEVTKAELNKQKGKLVPLDWNKLGCEFMLKRK